MTGSYAAFFGLRVAHESLSPFLGNVTPRAGGLAEEFLGRTTQGFLLALSARETPSDHGVAPKEEDEQDQQQR